MTTRSTTQPAAPDPIPDPTVEQPDATWQTIRDQAVSGLRDGDWTDHNVSDPGITMLEAAALSVADLHFRTDNRGTSDGPVASQLWDVSAHWSGTDIPAATGDVHRIATILNNHLDVLRAHVAAAADRLDAVAAVTTAPGLGIDYRDAVVVVRLLRSAAVRIAAFDGAGALDAIAEVADSDDEILAAIRLDPAFEGLWDSEILDLLRLRRRRRLIERVDELRHQIVGQSDPAAVAALVTLEPPLSADEALPAQAAMACPEVHPEWFENPDGSTLVWPPTAIQSRAVEPVIADDYARLALGVVGVRRAWVRQGQLAGTGWDGRPVAASSRPGTVTILVEAEPDAPADLERQVLRALGDPSGLGPDPEVDEPHALFRDDPTLLNPRRMICDEVGAATLQTCPVEIKAALHVAVGTIDDRSATISAAHERVAAFLEAGRPESQAIAADLSCPAGLEGPWPLPPNPPTGWIPGEPIRIYEVIDILASDPAILGVSGFGIRQVGTDWFSPGPDDIAELPIPDHCVPVLADTHCLTVAFVLEGEQ